MTQQHDDTKSATAEALVICGDDGSVYAVPLAMLEQCRVDAAPHSDVQGYVNAQPTPPGRTPSSYRTYGLAPVILPAGLYPGGRLGIIFVGGRGQAAANSVGLEV